MAVDVKEESNLNAAQQTVGRRLKLEIKHSIKQFFMSQRMKLEIHLKPFREV